MNRFTRYLLRAHIGPFFFAFVALTGVILINTLAKELASLAGKGLPFSVVVEFFILSLPANVALTMPMAVLVAVLYTFSTLAAENEITALRASGVDLRRVALPLIVAAAIIAGGMVWFNNVVLPAANYRWRMLMTAVAQTRALVLLEPQTINSIPSETGTPAYYLEAGDIDSGTGLLRDVRIYDVSRNDAVRTIDADSGRMAMNPEQTDMLLTLFDGSVHEVSFADQAKFQTFTFERQIMRMDGVSARLERRVESSHRTDRDMTLGMMRTRIDSLRVDLAQYRERQREAREEHERRLAEAEALMATRNSDTSGAKRPDSAEVVASDAVSSSGTVALEDSGSAAVAEDAGGVATRSPLVEGVESRSEAERLAEARARTVQAQIRELQVEIHKKFAIASATLVFVLIGIPIALRFPRGGIGMVIAVSLGIFGIYYVGLIGGETLGDEGYIPAGLAMWATNIIFGVLGLLGFLRLGREQGTTRGSGWGELPKWLRLPRFRRQAVEAS